MDCITIVLFLCILVPILPVLTLLPDKRSRLFLGFLLIGVTICLIASGVNSLLLAAFGGDVKYVTSNITPLVEELLKGAAVLFFALFCSDERDTLISVSLAVGLGFALLENMLILTQNIGEVTAYWALARGLGAALMHSACTAAVGLGISSVRKRRKLFFCGTFSLLIAAAMIHAVLICSHSRSTASSRSSGAHCFSSPSLSRSSAEESKNRTGRQWNNRIAAFDTFQPAGTPLRAIVI